MTDPLLGVRSDVGHVAELIGKEKHSTDPKPHSTELTPTLALAKEIYMKLTALSCSIAAMHRSR